MKSRTLGKSTSEVEVTNISGHGFWLLVQGDEHFLPFADFPWFKNACVADILAVELIHDRHLFWAKLDVDLELESLQNPSRWPLVAKTGK